MARDHVSREHACGVELGAAVLCLELDCNTVFDRSAVDVRGAAAPNRTRWQSGSTVASMPIDGISDLRSHASSHRPPHRRSTWR